MTEEIIIVTTGLKLNPQSILKKYKALNRVKDSIKFDLLYYPYWVSVVLGIMNGFLVKDRPAAEMMIVDGVTERIRKIVHYPETEQTIVKAENTVIENLVTRDKALSLCEAEAVRIWEKMKFHPLRPSLKATLKETKLELIYKPYWVLNNGQDMTVDKILLVDATTGISNSPESGRVVSKWLEQMSNRK